MTRKATARKAKGFNARQRLGIAVGSVGVAVLGLSVAHCTTAIAALTGSNLFLAALLAVGIDAGMVACELASIAAGEDARVRRWATCYICLAVLLSCGLNGWASAHHAEEALKWFAWAVGGLIPVLVFVLGKVAGLLWEQPAKVRHG
jgi:hypothetical protein